MLNYILGFLYIFQWNYDSDTIPESSSCFEIATHPYASVKISVISSQLFLELFCTYFDETMTQLQVQSLHHALKSIAAHPFLSVVITASWGSLYLLQWNYDSVSITKFQWNYDLVISYKSKAFNMLRNSSISISVSQDFCYVVITLFPSVSEFVPTLVCLGYRWTLYPDTAFHWLGPPLLRLYKQFLSLHNWKTYWQPLEADWGVLYRPPCTHCPCPQPIDAFGHWNTGKVSKKNS